MSGIALAVSASFAACGPPPQPDVPAPAPTTTSAPSAAPSAEPTAGPPGKPRDSGQGPNGETAKIVGMGLEITSATGAVLVVEPTELHPPAGDRALLGISPTTWHYLDDGTLLVGLGDGTVTALDGAGRRRFSIGFRGDITLASAGPDLALVTTSRGVMAMLGGDGKVRWERHLTAEPLSPAVVAKDGSVLAASERGVFGVTSKGEPTFSHALSIVNWPCSWSSVCSDEAAPPTLAIEGDDVVVDGKTRFPLAGPHTPVPSLVPTFPLTFRKVLTESVVSLLPDGPTALLALVTNRKERSDYDWGTDDRYDVARIEGERVKRTGVPETSPRAEVFEKKSSKQKSPLYIDALVRGPTGDPWILARRFSMERTQAGDGMMVQFGGAGQILELVSGKVRERTDLFKTFFDHWVVQPIAAAPEGTAKLFCFGFESPVCTFHDGASFRVVPSPGRLVAARTVGSATWLLDEKGKLFRLSDDGKEILPLSQPKDTRFRRIAGADEKDMWAEYGKRYSASHLRGASWEDVPTPVPVAGLTARAADDVWGGRMRWDGKAWSLVHGAPVSQVVLARTKDDVWAGEARGLWHGTAPGPVPARLPAATAEDAPASAAVPIDLGAEDAHLYTMKMTIDVAGEKPLTAATGVAATAEGVLWLTAWDRLVEVDAAGKGTRLRGAGKEGVGRMAFPEGKGRGVFLDRDERRGSDWRDQVRTLDARAAATPDIQLDRHDLVAVHGDPGGSLWVLGRSPVFGMASRFRYEEKTQRSFGASAWEEFGAHALVRPARGAPFQPVLGLPAAAWCDVAATSDGGAWFAGAQSDGPAGEGVLFHAKGRLGIEATSRFRASAALLAVSAASPEEAWAVGAGGTIVHVTGSVVTRFALRSGEWLRSVLAVGPNEVLIGGDGGTLLYWDGSTFRPVSHTLGPNATFTGIAYADGHRWAVGPSGIVKLMRRIPS